MEGAAAGGFVRPIRARDRPIRQTAQIHRAGFQPRRVRAPGRIPGPGPGCGLGAGESVGSAHAGVGRGPPCHFGPTQEKQEPVSVFSFSWKIENTNWLKRKIEKGILPVGKIQEIEHMFSAAKEKYILQLY